MKNRLFALGVAPLALIVGLAACGGDDATGPGLQFDPAPVEDLMRAQVASFQVSYPANLFLATILPELSSAGVEFDGGEPGLTIQTLGPVLEGLGLPGVQPLVTIPEAVQGATFVYDGGRAAWEIDEALTGAPPTGIRITWYELDGSGFPLTNRVRGYIDLTDEDGDGLSRLGVHVVAVDNAAETSLAQYTVGYARTDDPAWTERIEAIGWVSDGTHQLDFDIGADGGGDSGTGDSSVTFDIHVEGLGGSYDLDLGQEVVGATSDVQEDWIVIVVTDGQTTRLTIGFSGTQDRLDADGVLSHQGAVVAYVTAQDGGSFTYTDADGERFVNNERAKLQTLIATMFSTAGYYLLNAVPILYL